MREALRPAMADGFAGVQRAEVFAAIEPLVAPDGRAAARLRLKLDRTSGPLPVDSQVAIRPRSPLGLRYVQVTPGRASRTVPQRGTIDLRREEGRELFFGLVREADVFMENNAANVVEHLGIDYEQLSAVNPRLIMMRFPGFGIDAPVGNMVL